MLVYIIGRIPPPIGGVTIHTARLIEYLSKIDGCNVKHVDIGLVQFIFFALNCLRFKNRKTIVHCQLSSIYGLAIISIILILTFSKAKIVYSLHSEYWKDRNINKSRFRSLLSKYFLQRISLLIADNDRIQKEISPFVKKVEVLTPFLPPQGALGCESLSEYLRLPDFDSPVLVFNAYKLVYSEDGRDIYGLDILLSAYQNLMLPATLLILIPNLTLEKNEYIKNQIKYCLNKSNINRVHIISDLVVEGWKVIGKSDIFIRPTITDGDALSVREALYFGTHTIASDCTTRPQGVVLFKTGDSKNLCDAISSILEKDKYFERIPIDNSVKNNFFGKYSDLF